MQTEESTVSPVKYKSEYLSALSVSRIIADDCVQFWRRLALSESDLIQLELCVVELVNNVVEHAYDYAINQPILCETWLEEQKLQFRVSDYGSGMSEANLMQAKCCELRPPDPKDCSTWHSSGRGLQMVVRMVDEIQHYQKQGMNTTHIGKLIEHIEPS
ncbi:Serine-protein kinase RsbW [Vibrio stylophorae]|uniref:Serine-protein kinase RsbW n=1 Tax=Vibrio stylophorae TaxID=659351 RepID=A0ABN8DX25_9VIBR|nr:ATP-binding protein [Vibrio stylophorae]CAH0535175.1 Serine-protein kinase RsbW [Vibrio stylophorae]